MKKWTPEALSKLSRPQKNTLYDLIQEKKRRLKLKGAVFTPHAQQIPIFKSTAKERWVTSGNGFGKTTLAIHDSVWTAKGFNPVSGEFNKVPIRVICLLDAPPKVEDVWLPEIRKWFDISKWIFNKRGKPYITQIIFPNGSEILFMFHQQETMAFESIEWGHLVCDEPPPRHVYVALKRGGRTKGYKNNVLVVGTPISQAWIRTDVIEPWSRGERKDTDCFTGDTEANRANLSEGYIEEFSSRLSEQERRTRLHGAFFDMSGLALAHLWDRGRHIIPAFDWPRNWPCKVIIDPASAKPTVAAILGCNHEGDYIYIDEISIKCSPRQFARKLKPWYEPYPIVDIICDSIGSSPTSGGYEELSFIEVLAQEGIRARSTRRDEKDDERWMNMIQDVLLIPEGAKSKPKLQVIEGNKGIVGDIENVQWLKYKNEEIFKPKLDITKKDFLACLKYYLMSNPGASRGRAKIHKPSTALNWRNRGLR